MRIFYNNTIFCITYTKSSKYNGLCKYKKKISERNISLPYLEINENKLLNERNKNLEDLIFNDIFEERNKICDESECFVHNKYILNKKYIDVILPHIIIFNIDFIDYPALSKYKKKLIVYLKIK